MGRDQKKQKAAMTSEDNASDSDHSPHSPSAAPKCGDKSKAAKSRIRKHESDDDDAAADTAPTVKKPRVGNQVHRTKEGSSYIDLGKKRRVTVSVFKGMPLIDIREYYGSDGDEKPGKKGISLSVEQWEIIKDNFDMIDQLLSELKK